MDETRPSLIIRLKDHRDEVAWGQFNSLYGPLLYRYARTRGLSQDDAEEVKSQCLAVVVQQIGAFEYDRAKGGFKNWLRRIAYNKIMDLFRKRREKVAESQELCGLMDGEPTPDEAWDRQWQQSHLKYCLEQVRADVSSQNYRAFHMLVFEERPVEEVCSALGMNTNQVYKAKSRILERVREKMSELGVD